MPRAANVSCTELTRLILRLPQYDRYVSSRRAAAAERSFRTALGRMLKECGDRLLTVAERRATLLSAEQEAMLDTIVENIAAIFRRLDRQGQVTLVGQSQATIAELEELDTRLLLLLEGALALTRQLHEDVPETAWFAREAPRLFRDLADFSQTAEERNYLLGLGWESEFSPSRRH